MLKLAIYTIGDDSLPSTRFRITQYVPALKAAGIETKCFFLPGTSGGKIGQLLGSFWQGIVRFWQLRKAGRYDLVFVQKGLTPWRCRGLVGMLRSCGSPYVVDIDDAVYATTPVRFPPYLRWLQNENEPNDLFARASHIIAGNRFLSEHVKRYGKNVSIIPTPVDTDRYAACPRKNAGKVVIGWSGSVGTNFYLNLLIPALQTLAKDQAFSFLIISNSLHNVQMDGLDGIETEFLQWNSETELADLQKIDIGVMPLCDDEWSRGKCGLKALLYMALGIPAVCSPVGVNVEIIRDGENGFLAATDDEWIDKLRLLIRSEDVRADIGSRARKTVENNYSVAVNAPALVSLLKGIQVSGHG
jgi:glycosyltransferase involved in cell wall biosynthesis